MLLEKFPEGHGDTDEDEHCVSPTDEWSVGEDIHVLEDMMRVCILDLS